MKLERLLGRCGSIKAFDDPTFLQLNDRSSELPFCCKRGHSAILPSTQYLPRAWSAHCATGVLNPWRWVSAAGDAATELHAMDVACRACRGIGRQKPRYIKSIPGPHSPASNGLGR